MEVYLIIIDTLAAIGTVGATIVALWLALRDHRQSVDGIFIWETATLYHPTLLIHNTSSRIVVIDNITIKYRNKRICKVDVLDSVKLAEYAVIDAGQTKKLPQDLFDLRIPDQQKKQKGSDKRQKERTKKHKLKVIIQLRNGRKRTSVMKYSYRELMERHWGQALFADNRSQKNERT